MIDEVVLKLLYVVNVDWFFISHRLPIALRALELGYEVHLAAADSGKRRYIESLGIHFHDVSFSRSSGSLFMEIKVLLQLKRLVNDLCPDIIHAVTIKAVLYTGLIKHISKGRSALIFAISGLGYVFTSASLRARLTRAFVTLFYRVSLSHNNKYVIFQNDVDEELLTRVAKLKKDERVKIRGSGVDLRVYRYTVQVDTDKIQVVMASRLLKEKGVYDFVEAARLLKGQKNIEFVLAGSVDEDSPSAVAEEEIQQWVEEGLIVYLGARDDIPLVFERSHIVTLPSYYGEGVPKVLIEAAACGRPIVTTDNPGCRDSVIEGETGLIVPKKDASALARAILKLAEDAPLRELMGANARLFAEKEFDVRAVVQRHIELYQDLTSH